MKSSKILLTLAFIEGAAVMACELISAKMIAPFFGSSLYVWAAVLGVTLFALMSGYYLGGYLSQKIKSKNLIYFVLMLAGFFLMIMPFTSIWIMKETIDLSIRLGSTISLLIFMFPPLLFMGMSSPIIIHLINQKVESTGKSTGSIYALSTFGGILSTFLVGFYLLPELGIKTPSYLFGSLLFIAALIPLVFKNKWNMFLLLIPVMVIFPLSSFQNKLRANNIELIYESEGVLGQIRVIDMPFHTYTRGTKQGRLLMVNNTAQTIMNKDDLRYDLWDWSYYFPTAASIYPKKSKVLILGLGGGAFIKQFKRMGFDIDVVELDARIRDVNLKYFDLDPSINVIVDDARHYINNNTKKYDIVFFDVFYNETPPAHVLTKECFQKTKSFLKEDGMIMLNFFGFLTEEEGLAARSIYTTLKASGFQVELLPTPGQESHRNLLFLATFEEKDFTNTYFEEPGMPVITNLSEKFIDKDRIDFSDGVILRDQQPILEKMYLSAALKWRRVSIDYNTKKFIEADLGLIR
ncbi:MAG: fused MFS/spermidine synthase [Brumimicrobium sp.]|nr:fused MFS/spermidine synthase [Brumimicrobium sp.]